MPGVVPRAELAVNDIPKAQQQLFDPERSARRKYAELVVGRFGWLALLRHEAILLLSQGVPGALGLALRRVLFPALLGSCGRHVVFGQHVVLRHPHKIRIGSNVVIDDNCLLDAKGTTNAGITIGSGVFIGRNTILSCKNGDIEIGDEANLGFNCEVFSASRVTIGRKVLCAAYCYLIGGTHEFGGADRAVLDQGRVSAGIRVGDGAWLGAGVKVLDGVDVGAHAIVGAGCVVRTAVPDYGVVVGRVGRLVGSRQPGAEAAASEPQPAGPHTDGEGVLS